MTKNTYLFLQYKDERTETKIGNAVINKKEFHVSKHAISLNLVDTNKIVISDKSKFSYDGSKCFIGYLHDNDIIRPLCIILPQMSGYIKFVLQQFVLILH